MSEKNFWGKIKGFFGGKNKKAPECEAPVTRGISLTDDVVREAEPEVNESRMTEEYKQWLQEKLAEVETESSQPPAGVINLTRSAEPAESTAEEPAVCAENPAVEAPGFEEPATEEANPAETKVEVPAAEE